MTDNGKANGGDTRMAAMLADARKQLIDIGTRNRLVHTARGGRRVKALTIVDADADAVFTALVHAERKLRFAPGREEDDGQTSAESPPETPAQSSPAQSSPAQTSPPAQQPTPMHPEAASQPGTVSPDASSARPAGRSAPPEERQRTVEALRTRLSLEPLRKRLLGIYRDARTLEEEQGVNILFLALGFLRWYETGRSDVLREAPLVLVPVSLSRDERRSSFTLEARDEEIAVNQSLRERLRADFGLTLPDIPEGESWTPSTYFEAVAQAVASQTRWSIDRNGAELGFYSFAKLLMVRDLERENWKDDALARHPLVRGLLSEGFAREQPLFPAGASLDTLFAPSDLVQVLDADSSQTLVIEAVRRGRNLVVQGPPGTGKSQTIANIVAGAVADGKKVLFVAEKMAALQVVHDRLKRAGLGAVCLELHSRAASKRIVAEELERTLAESAPSLASAVAAQDLQSVRDALNDGERALNTPVGDTGASARQALATQVALSEKGAPPPALDLPGAAAWSAQAALERRAAVAALAQAAIAVGAREDHPWRGVAGHALQPADLQRMAARAQSAADAAPPVAAMARKVAQTLGAADKATMRAAANLAHALRIAGELPPTAVEAALRIASADALALTQQALQRADAWKQARAACGAAFQPAAWQADVLPLRGPIATGAASFIARWGWNGDYRAASRALAGLLTQPVPGDPTQRLALVDALLAEQQARAHLRALDARALGDLWRGEDSDFAALAAAADWLQRLKATGAGADVARVAALAQQLDGPARVSDIAQGIDGVLSPLADHVSALTTTLGLDAQRAFGVADIADADLETLTQRLRAWSTQTDRYHEWSDLMRAEQAARACGLDVVVDALAQGALDARRAVDEFDYARAEAIWRRAAQDQPALGPAAGRARDDLVSRFRTLEQQRRIDAAAQVRARHAQDMPRGALGAMAVVRGEIAKKRAHMPVRKLIERAGGAIAGIKPVFLMSPISVAQFLPPGALEFDLLVVDEASQVRPEDALGCVARSRQMVVVGDRRQLPPTSFFDRLVATDDDDEDADAPQAGAPRAGHLESILTMCEAAGVESAMLRWHYRSRHPSLIEVSNAEFYRNLILPPSPSAERIAEGMILRRVAGAYDRGGKRTNAVEAQAVVEAVKRHAREMPEQSLGVATFSTVQRDLIGDLLEQARRDDEALDAFLREDGHEDVFVKNLENVQGDERDVIFISVGYGPREAGKSLDSMNFGPVSSEGGERRLNVLFTRARLRCEIFVSFESGDIVLERAQGEGPRVLKRFLRFAETGVVEQPHVANADDESPLEDAVAAVIAGMGYRVDRQVGSAGFRVDLAVRDPARPGRYMLAVECDGAAYHNALWARERDRLRQDVLEGLGWRFHRIWSTDWFHRRAETLAKLRAALEAAQTASTPAPKVVAPAQSSPPQREPERTEPAPQTPATEPQLFAPPDLFAPRISAAPPDQSQRGAPYRVATRAVSATGEPHEAPLNKLAAMAADVVEHEGPIHQDEVARRIAGFFNKDRAGQRISAATMAALLHARTTRAIETEHDFWFTPAQRAAPPVRNRALAPSSVQRADMIAQMEIAAAIALARRQNGGLSRDETPLAVARLFGFQRAGPELRAAILSAFDSGA